MEGFQRKQCGVEFWGVRCNDAKAPCIRWFSATWVYASDFSKDHLSMLHLLRKRDTTDHKMKKDHTFWPIGLTHSLFLILHKAFLYFSHLQVHCALCTIWEEGRTNCELRVRHVGCIHVHIGMTKSRLHREPVFFQFGKVHFPLLKILHFMPTTTTVNLN